MTQLGEYNRIKILHDIDNILHAFLYKPMGSQMPNQATVCLNFVEINAECRNRINDRTYKYLNT